MDRYWEEERGLADHRPYIGSRATLTTASRHKYMGTSDGGYDFDGRRHSWYR
jgi:hypothetical protein